MATFVLEIWDDEVDKCTFYSVRDLDAERNVTDKFFEKYNNKTFQQYTQELLSFVVDVIGNRHGALDVFFNREENEVKGLPNRGKARVGNVVYAYPGFPLRLYAMKVTESIVVLFGGGVKDGATNQVSSLGLNWREACSMARRITEAILEGDIVVDDEEWK